MQKIQRNCKNRVISNITFWSFMPFCFLYSLFTFWYSAGVALAWSFYYRTVYIGFQYPGGDGLFRKSSFTEDNFVDEPQEQLTEYCLSKCIYRLHLKTALHLVNKRYKFILMKCVSNHRDYILYK